MEIEKILDSPPSRKSREMSPRRQILPTMCGLTAARAVGTFSNVLRLITAIILAASAVLSFLIASGILSSVIPIVMYISAGIQLIATVVISFDLSTAKWLIEKVLDHLSKDIMRLEYALSDLNNTVDKLEQTNVDLSVNLQRAEVQVHERETQLRKTELQIDKLELQLTDLDKLKSTLSKQLERYQRQLENDALVNSNMQTLLKSMLDANANGVDMNKVFSENVRRLENTVNILHTTTFDILDLNNDGIISKDEFNVHVATHINTPTTQNKK